MYDRTVCVDLLSSSVHLQSVRSAQTQLMTQLMSFVAAIGNVAATDSWNLV